MAWSTCIDNSPQNPNILATNFLNWVLLKNKKGVFLMMKVFVALLICMMTTVSFAASHTKEELTIYKALDRVFKDTGRTCENMKALNIGDAVYVVRVLKDEGIIQIAELETKKVVVDYVKKELRIYDITAGKKLLEILEAYLFTECTSGESSDDQVG